MPDYNVNSTLGQPIFSPKDTQFPFEVTCRVIPEESQGRRLVRYRSGEMTTQMLQNDLLNAGWVLASPFTFVPAYGNKSAYIKFRGFLSRDVGGTDQTDDVPPFKPTSQVTKIHSGTVPGEKTAEILGDPGGGNLSYGQEPVPTLNELYLVLVAALEADSTLFGTAVTIERVDLMGVVFGKGARSFPQP